MLSEWEAKSESEWEVKSGEASGETKEASEAGSESELEAKWEAGLEEKSETEWEAETESETGSVAEFEVIRIRCKKCINRRTRIKNRRIVRTLIRIQNLIPKLNSEIEAKSVSGEASEGN